ncbi:hypothetical protein GCM10027591_07740 [Zhihengliuella somnathii]
MQAEQPQQKQPKDWTMFSAGIIPGILVGVLIGAGLAGGIGGGSARAGITAALDECSMSGESPGVYVLDDGAALELDGSGTGAFSGGLETSDQVCILKGLGIPESAFSRMSSTRALDGTQTTSWDGYQASWTYHPDDGLHVIVEPVDR